MIELAEIYRLLHAMASVGTVTAVDPERGCRVSVGERETGWLKVPGYVGRNWRASLPLRVGTQVKLLCASGNPANAVIVQILYSNDLPAPSADEDLDVFLFDDGTSLSYHSGQQLLEVESPGRLRIKVTGDVTIETDSQVLVKAADSITVDAGGELTLKAGGDIRVNAGGTLHLDAAAIRALEGG